jgi:hypothetical protein
MSWRVQVWQKGRECSRTLVGAGRLSDEAQARLELTLETMQKERAIDRGAVSDDGRDEPATAQGEASAFNWLAGVSQEHRQEQEEKWG